MTSSTVTPISPVIPSHKVLIVGVDGAIGSALEKHLVGEGYQVIGSTRRLNHLTTNRLYLNLEDSNTFTTLEHQKFDAAVICGAVSSLRACEERPASSKRVNVDGTIGLAKALMLAGTYLIFLSTNLVFDGSKPYFLPLDVKNPVTQYGKQKAEVEDWLVSDYPASAIIRFGKVLPPRFPLFVQWQNHLISGKIIRPYAFKTMAPLSLNMAVEILSCLIAERKPGIFQATANSDITYAQAAIHLARLCHANPDLVHPIESPCPGEHGDRAFHEYLFNTLQTSSDFAHLANNLSPIDALHDFCLIDTI